MKVKRLPNLTGPEWGPAAGGRPEQLVVLCHGVGSDGNDLIALAPFLGRALPHALFVAPDGPEPYNMGPAGRQWFPIGAINPAVLGGGVRRAALALDGYIDAKLADHALAPEAYALAGFSQGAMTVLFAGLRRAGAPRAILAYSGALIDAPALAAELANRAPVLLVHGVADGVVPASRSREAEAVLRGAGVPVESLFSPGLGHSIDNAGIAAGVTFLQKAFA